MFDIHNINFHYKNHLYNYFHFNNNDVYNFLPNKTVSSVLFSLDANISPFGNAYLFEFMVQTIKS